MASFARSVRRRNLAEFKDQQMKAWFRTQSNFDYDAFLSDEDKEKKRKEQVRQGLKRNKGDYTPLKKKRK